MTNDQLPQCPKCSRLPHFLASRWMFLRGRGQHTRFSRKYTIPYMDAMGDVPGRLICTIFLGNSGWFWGVSSWWFHQQQLGLTSLGVVDDEKNTPGRQPKCMKSYRNPKRKLGGGFQYFLFSYLGKWSNLTNFFQVGWNHQLGKGSRIVF